MAGYANPYAVNWPLQDDSPPQTATTYYENYSRNNSVSRPSIGAYYPPGRAIVRSGTDRSASSGGTTDSEKSRSNARYGGRPFDDEKKSSAGNGTANAADTTVWLDEKIRSPLTTSSGERIELHRNDAATSQVVGTTQLYDQGRLRLIPMPTPDPKDPLNLPQWRKWLAVCVVSLFGSLALSAELVIGGLLPVFVLDYAGVPVSLLNDNRNLPALLSGSGAAGGSLNPLAIIPPGTPPGPPVEQIALLATVPLVGNSVASYLLVPLSVAIGRRPVLILAAAAAWGGGAWAGLSTSLLSHIMARAMLGLGAGAVEALIPLVIQDLMFIHERNTAMAVVVGAQGIFTVAFGVAAPVIATRYYWRLLYVITSGATFLAWLAVIAAVPETRWTRCREELSGQNIFPLRPGANRPDLDARTYGPRTRQTDLALFPFGFEWRQAGGAILETLKTTFFPTVLWAVVANAIFIVAAQAAGQIGAFALLAQGWQFQYTGLATITFLAAGVLAFVFGGPLADMLSNKVTRWNGGGREPEHHLPNLVLPFLAGILGAFLFGWAAENNLHWAVLLGGVTLIVFASLTVLTILNVFIVESYPMWAGAVLVNVSSCRLLVAFFVSSQAIPWILSKGVLGTFALYGEAMIVISLGVPALYFGGKWLRRWTGGWVVGVRLEKRILPDK